MTKEEKIAKAKELTGEELLKAYDLYRDNFNPINDESIENFQIAKAELLNRLK